MVRNFFFSKGVENCSEWWIMSNNNNWMSLVQYLVHLLSPIAILRIFQEILNQRVWTKFLSTVDQNHLKMCKILFSKHFDTFGTKIGPSLGCTDPVPYSLCQHHIRIVSNPAILTKNGWEFFFLKSCLKSFRMVNYKVPTIFGWVWSNIWSICCLQ